MKIKKHILTIGLNDKDAKMQKITTIEAYKMVENVLKQYTDGYTIYETHGGYKHDDGTYVEEKSLRVELLFIDLKQVYIIANNLKTMLNQESIALEIINSNSSLI